MIASSRSQIACRPHHKRVIFLTHNNNRRNVDNHASRVVVCSNALAAAAATSTEQQQQQRRRQRQRRPRTTTNAASASNAAPAATAAADIEALAAEFKEWFLSQAPGQPADLTPRPASGPLKGLCMVAAAPVEQGTPLLLVPRKLLMTADTARACPHCGPVIKRAGLDDWQALILHLLYESADPASRWVPYLRLLRATSPPEQRAHPLLWGTERRVWLAGSPMARTLDARRAQVEADAAALDAAGANALKGGGGGGAAGAGAGAAPPLVTPASVGWAASVLLSRAFSLYLGPTEPDHAILPMEDFGSWDDRPAADALALAPWADLLHHSFDAGDASVLAYDAELGAAALSASAAYAAGDEVHDSYGRNLAPCDTLLDYGFVEAARGGGGDDSDDDGGGRNNGGAGGRYDARPAEIVPAPRGPRNAALLKALDRLQGEGALLPLGRAGPDVTGLTVLRAALAGDAELVRAGWKVRASPRDVGAAARALGRLSRPAERTTEAAILKALTSFLSAATAAYPSTLTADEAELAQLERQEQQQQQQQQQEEALEQHLRLQALRALVSEKRALAGATAAVAAWQARLDAGAPLAEVYADITGGGDDDGDLYDE